MAKKKKKTFQKGQLLSMFQNGNYQKVISKIKQFKIEGMSEEELQHIKLTSYERLAQTNFESGDIARAMRDIESLLAIDNSEEFRLIKLKYLCYMEHFQDAIEFGEELILSKVSKIKKEAMFFSLLANIYYGNYTIDEKNLKLLPIARQNYILGFREFLQGRTGRALIFFDKCNPRAKVEKENIKAIKSIMLNQNGISSNKIKPLYRFLISGDDTNLQNTKNSREIKKEIQSQFAKEKKNSEMKHLLSLKSSIPIETIIKEIKDEEQQARLIYNNIVLLAEKQKNIPRALELFVKHRRSLIQFVESGILFIKMKSLEEDRKSDKLLVNFFSSYLKLHYKKLSQFQLDFIFAFLLRKLEGGNVIKLIEEYGGEDILFLFKKIALINKVEPWHQDRFNNIMKKHSLLKDKALDGLSEYIDILDENIDKAKAKEKELLVEQLSQLIILFRNCQKIDKKYQSTVLKILSSMAKFIQNFEFSKNRDLYIQLSETINSFIDMYKIDRVDLSKDIKRLFSSIEEKRSTKKEKKSDNESMFDMFKQIVDDYGDVDDLFGDLDEEYLDDNDLARIKKDFIEALKNNEIPFNYELEDIEGSFDNDIIFEFILDLIAKAIEFDRYDDDFTQKLLYNMDIKPKDSYYREDLIVAIKKYAKKDIKTAIIFFYDCITLVHTNQRETVWYLKWLEAYVYLVDDYNEPKNLDFKGCLYYFIRVQQKKRFKTLDARFKKLIDRFKDKGLF
ncbi:hypothetical protein MNB_SV-12-1366 [hydrothermal vent metagenome]|uniref:Uncharacterized protein n=1 Tax=hydrothermal vent metagenome TaxID=652676 RepID=A0A1W1CLB5_9ZZZZ